MPNLGPAERKLLRFVLNQGRTSDVATAVNNGALKLEEVSSVVEQLFRLGFLRRQDRYHMLYLTDKGEQALKQ